MSTIRQPAPGRPSTAVVDEGLRSLAADGGFDVAIRGASMEPRLPDGTRLHLRRPGLLLPGDVVAIRSGERLLVHRILGAAPRKGGWRLLTQGDAAPRPDGWLDPAGIIGVADLPCPPILRLKALAGFGLALVRGIHHRLKR